MDGKYQSNSWNSQSRPQKNLDVLLLFLFASFALPPEAKHGIYLNVADG